MKGKNIENKVYVLEEGAYRFLFSMHSSLEEIEAFVKLLKPKKITPISQPTSMTPQKVHK
jgi:mRNA degradation ribonuclease J1/J2